MKSKIIGLLLVCIMLVNLSGCSKSYTVDLMSGITANSVSEKTVDETFINSQMRLALELFKASAKESENKNVLVSPLSIQLGVTLKRYKIQQTRITTKFVPVPFFQKNPNFNTILK